MPDRARIYDLLTYIGCLSEPVEGVLLNGLGSYRVCIAVTPTVATAPVNVHLKLPIVASEVIGG